MGIKDKLAEFAEKLFLSVKSMVKILLESGKCTVDAEERNGESLVIMGNGPSLKQTIEQDGEKLRQHPLMAVNYAIRSDEFFMLKPEYYTMIDPAFFNGYEREGNVRNLWKLMIERVDWPMTLFVPVKAKVPADLNRNGNLRVERINPIGVEGFEWLEDWTFRSGKGMPRPRNVLIGSLMVGLKLGYRKIFVVGADHTWTENLQVNGRNELCAVENHFYKEGDDDHAARASIYRGVRMHQMMYSLYVAFKSYFAIERYARKRGVEIINATPHSFIDAFERGAF